MVQTPARGLGADDPFAPAAAAGIHRLAIPTPFAVGRVNVYVIEDEPLTLVDAGPNSGTSFDELRRGVAGLGHSLEDIELVILTHQHIDHLGLVSLVAAQSGADVAAIDAAVPFVENYSLEAQADDEFARDIMFRNGIPEDVVTALQSVSQAFRAWGARAHVTRVLRDGEEMVFSDRTLHVHHRPGHSPTDTVFHDRERRILIAADHLLKHISSNPLITRSLDGSGERPQALVTYLRSLEATRRRRYTVRLIGIDTPELYDGVECGGRKASANLKPLATGRRVLLRTDPSQDTFDRYDRLLAYAKLRGLFSSFTANDPQLQVTIDRQRALALGLPFMISDSSPYSSCASRRPTTSATSARTSWTPMASFKH